MNIVEKLSGKGLTLSTCESCTGGMIASYITDFAGSSKVFTEGVVTYANEAKMRLGVSGETLLTFGAVSPECAEEMARSVRKRTNTNIAVSTTGIAGPDGGTPEKPVGLVYSCIITDKCERIYKLDFSGTRDEIRKNTVKTVIQNILEAIENDY